MMICPCGISSKRWHHTWTQYRHPCHCICFCLHFHQVRFLYASQTISIFKSNNSSKAGNCRWKFVKHQCFLNLIPCFWWQFFHVATAVKIRYDYRLTFIELKNMIVVLQWMYACVKQYNGNFMPILMLWLCVQYFMQDGDVMTKYQER